VIALAVTFVVLTCAAIASAQEPTDTLFVTGQADFLSAGNGGAGSVEWLRKTDRRGVHAGLQSGSRPEAWWTYGRAGGFSRRGRLLVAGAFDAGGGARSGARFLYQKLAAEVGVLLASGRIVVETEGQLAHVAPDTSRIFRLGLKWRPTAAMTAGASYYALSLNRTVTPVVAIRLDVDRGRTSALGGAVFAQRREDAPLLSDIVTRLTATEFFAGGGFRVGSYRLQMVANVARSRRDASRLMVSLELPLKR
jgi:hypothetical protein